MTTTIDTESTEASLPDRELSPPSIKRKHDQISDSTLVNGDTTADGNDDDDDDDDDRPSIDIQSSIRLIWQILHARNYPPSIISHISSYQINSNNQPAHSEKRQKLSSANDDLSIASKVGRGSYRSLDSFASDVESACNDLLKSSQASEPFVSSSVNVWTLPPGTLERQRLAAHVSSITKLLRSLLQRELQPQRLASSEATPIPKLEQSQEEPKINGTANAQDTHQSSPIPTESGRAVLTLFGNAQGQKQLFSSLQRPFAESKTSGSSFDSTVDSVVPLRENGLPPGISSTKVIPMPKDDSTKSNKKQRLTLQDTFSTPASVAAVAPPKTPKSTSARQSAMAWSQPHIPAQRSIFGYTSEKLATGAWLGYDGVAPAEESTTPQAKRKQRDRALSSGEATFNASQTAKVAQLQAEEEALFRGVYSSFAPSIDNSSALIPEETRNNLWWQRYGDQFFHPTFTDETDADSVHSDAEQDSVEADEDKIFKEAVENFVPATFPAPVKESDDTDAEALLEEVSQMLETLHSYQRIRLSSLSSSDHRSNLLQNSPLQDLTGDANNPSTGEIETYKTLKNQLALLVSMLPPFAVAKLNGDQLADLNISREIPVEMDDYRGIMEEDKASREAKQAAFQAAVGMAATSNRHTPIQPSNQARTPHIPQSSSRGMPSHQQYNQNTPKALPRAQSQFSRQPLSSWQSPHPIHRANTQRPAYASATQYDQQHPRNMNTPIRPGYAQSPSGRPGSSHQLPNGSYQNPGSVNYQQPQRPHNFNGPANYNMPNGNYAPTNASPARIMPQQPQRNLSSQTQHQSHSPQMPMAQQPLHPPQTSSSQHNPATSPQQQHYRAPTQQMSQKSPQTMQSSSQQLQQTSSFANSPLPRPSSSAGMGSLTGTGNTETAVESRSITPATSVAAATPAPPQTDAQSPPQASASDMTLAPRAMDVSIEQIQAETKADVEPQAEESTPMLQQQTAPMET